MTVDELSVNQIIMGEVSADKIIVGKMSLDRMNGNNTSVM